MAENCGVKKSVFTLSPVLLEIMYFISKFENTSPEHVGSISLRLLTFIFHLIWIDILSLL
jgi:hypothetical protein